MNHKHPTPRRGLGRGLGSLIPTGPPEQAGPRAEEQDSTAGSYVGAHSAVNEAVQSAAESAATPVSTVRGPPRPPSSRSGRRDVAGAYFAELPVSSISPNARQPRQDFDEEAMAELVHSIKEVGLLQPVVVRRTGASSYELIMGERRWRAVQQVGLDTIPAIVRQTGDDDMLRDALLENLHRSELNPLEEAAAYRQLLDDFGCTHDELAGEDRAQPSADQQHVAAAEPLTCCPASRGGRRHQRRTRPGAARSLRARGAGPARRAGGLRGHLGARARGARRRR